MYSYCAPAATRPGATRVVECGIAIAELAEKSRVWISSHCCARRCRSNNQSGTFTLAEAPSVASCWHATLPAQLAHRPSMSRRSNPDQRPDLPCERQAGSPSFCENAILGLATGMCRSGCRSPIQAAQDQTRPAHNLTATQCCRSVARSPSQAPRDAHGDGAREARAETLLLVNLTARLGDPISLAGWGGRRVSQSRRP